MTPLGPLPAHWQVVRLEEVFSPVNKKGREEHIQDAQSYRLLTVRLYAKGVVLRSKQTGARIGTKVLYKTKAGDFVFSKIDARNGAWGFVPEGLVGGLVSGDFPILQLRRSIADQSFMEFLLSRPVLWEPLRNLAVGTTNRRRLQVSQILLVFIPLPPLPEQRAIAHVLHTVQRAQEATERVIAALKELKKSLMRHLFTYGPVPISAVGATGRSPLRETELGPLPAHWQVVRLGCLVEDNILLVRNGFAQGEHNETGKGVPHLRPFNVTDDGNIDLSQIKYVAPPPDDDSHWIRPGDVIFNNTNSEELVGKTAFFSEKGRFVLSNHMTIVRVLKPNIVDAYWLARTLHHLWYLGLFRGLCRRHVNQASISLERLKGVELPLPPLPEQRAIADILQAVDRRIAAEEKRRAALQTLFRTLLHDLMTARRRLPADFIAAFASERADAPPHTGDPDGASPP
ncbi:MAG: restriction endonuclease subunit S [Ardenticatenia bacterium]|nr:MAG: restriction endonuclease subunit S [Ardenticatenia bacterium]